MMENYGRSLKENTAGSDNTYPLAFMLNVDWFNPFKTGTYLMGAIYLTIINLPIDLQFKEEFSVLVGLLPGPSEPSLSINSYLTPLVQELDCLSDGIWISTTDHPNGRVYVTGHLLCVSSDIPASRKACGFLGHNAKIGCNKCLKEFKRVNKRTIYAGFDEKELRTNESHREKAQEYVACTNSSHRQLIETSYGIRYSALLDLKYFDIIQGCCIDSMHNLFLGTSKHLMQLWTSRSIISKQQLYLIQERVNKLIHSSKRSWLNTPKDCFIFFRFYS